MWSDLARALEEQVETKTNEIGTLNDTIRSRDVAIEDLQEECNFKSKRIADLEHQCMVRSEKVTQLCDVMATKRTDEIREKLLQKSLLVVQCMEDNKALHRTNESLRTQLVSTNNTIESMKVEREKNRRLILELSDVVRALNSVTVNYERYKNSKDTINEGGGDGIDTGDGGGGGAPPTNQHQPLQNVRRKILAIEYDRQQLVQERDRLKEDNAIKDAKIEALEAAYHGVNDVVRDSSTNNNINDGNDDDGISNTLDSISSSSAEEDVEDVDVISVVDAKTPSSEYHDGVIDGNSPDDNDYKDNDNDDPSRGGIPESFTTTTTTTNNSSTPHRPKKPSNKYSTPQQEKDATTSAPVQSKTSDGDDRSSGSDSGTTTASCGSTDDSSSESTFSTLEAPPPMMVSLDEHDKLKRSFHKALDVIEKLKRDRQQQSSPLKRQQQQSGVSVESSSIQNIDTPPQQQHLSNVNKALKRELEDTKKEVYDLEDELGETLKRYDIAMAEFKAFRERHEVEVKELSSELENVVAAQQEEITRLHLNLDSTKAMYDDALVMNSTMKKESDDRVQELKELHSQLEKQYQDLEIEYSMKIETLERQIDESVKMHKQEYDNLKKAHQDNLDFVHRDHAASMDVQRKRYDDLKYEYDTFLEIHLKAEDDANRLKEQYKESLMKVLELESKVVECREAEARAELESQKKLSKVENSMQDLIRENHSMKHECTMAIKERKRLLEEADMKNQQLITEHNLAMLEKGKHQEESSVRYRELRRDFDAALIEHGQSKQEAVQQIQEVKQEMDRCKSEHARTINELNVARENAIAEAKMQAQKDFHLRETKLHREWEQKLDKLVSEATQRENEIQSRLTQVKLELQQHLESKAKAEMEVARHENDLVASWQQKLDKLLLQKTQRENEIQSQLIQLQLESKQQAEEVRLEARQQIAKFQSENEDFHKQLQSKDTLSTQYKELAAAYQCSLSKIEVILRQRGVAGVKRGTSRPHQQRGGIVSEKVKLLEKLTDTTLIIPPRVPANSPNKNEVMEDKFRRDYKNILDKLGYDADNDLACESTTDKSSTCSSVSISHDPSCLKLDVGTMAVIATKDAEVQTLATDKISQRCFVDQKDAGDSMYPFGEWWWVNNPLGGPDPHTIFLLHKMRLQRVHNSLDRRTITLLDELRHSVDESSSGLVGGPRRRHFPVTLPPESPKALYRSDESTVQMDDASTAEERARNDAERLQSDHLRRTVNVNAAKIRSQAREKEFRLLELQYNSLRNKFQEAVNSPSTTEQKVQNTASDRSADVTDKITSDDTSFQLRPDPSTRLTLPDGVSPTDQIKRQLLTAEFKVKATKLKLQAQKSLLEATQQDQQDQGQSLDNALQKQWGLELMDETQSSVIRRPPDGNEQLISDSEIGIRNLPSHSFDHSRINSEVAVSDRVGEHGPITLLARQDEEKSYGRYFLPSVVHIDGTRTMSCCSTSYEDGGGVEHHYNGDNDDPATSRLSPIKGGSHVAGAHVDASKNNNNNNSIINSDMFDHIQEELQTAKEAADIARRKLSEREENLRDVIFQYKELKDEHDRLTCTIERGSCKHENQKQHMVDDSMVEGTNRTIDTMCLVDNTSPYDVGTTNNVSGNDETSSVVSEAVYLQVKQEWVLTKAKLIQTKQELDRAQRLAESARERQREQKENLRDVIDQYKELQDEFLAVLQEKKAMELRLQHDTAIQQREDKDEEEKKSDTMTVVMSASDMMSNHHLYLLHSQSILDNTDSVSEQVSNETPLSLGGVDDGDDINEATVHTTNMTAPVLADDNQTRNNRKDNPQGQPSTNTSSLNRKITATAAGATATATTPVVVHAQNGNGNGDVDSTGGVIGTNKVRQRIKLFESRRTIKTVTSAAVKPAAITTRTTASGEQLQQQNQQYEQQQLPASPSLSSSSTTTTTNDGDDVAMRTATTPPPPSNNDNNNSKSIKKITVRKKGFFRGKGFNNNQSNNNNDNKNNNHGKKNKR